MDFFYQSIPSPLSPKHQAKQINSTISTGYMKNTLLSHAVNCNALIFYCLEQDEHTIHLTFDQGRHEKAVRELQKKSFTILRKAAEKMQSTTLKNLLMQSTPYTTLNQSLFIHHGTSFQQQVWQLISQIPPGATQTYGHLAERMGNKRLARAVGQACNANPLALLIPCHRVVGLSELGGFAGGAEIKKKLLQLEASLFF